MYSLRDRDLTPLTEGAAASQAAKVEPWLAALSGKDERAPEAARSRPASMPAAHLYGKAKGRRDEVPPLATPTPRSSSSTSARQLGERDADKGTQHAGEFEQLKAQHAELRASYKELKSRFDKRGLEISRLHDRIRRLEKSAQTTVQEKKEPAERGSSILLCRQACCIPLIRLEKAGLNVEAVQDLDAKWAGYVFSVLTVQAKSSGMTLYEIFRKHTDAHGRIGESAFRNLIRQFIPTMSEERLTRLFYFADTDGSGMLNLLEFLRLFGFDMDGKMGEEYFEHVMVRIQKAVSKNGGFMNVLKLSDKYLNASCSRQRLLDAISPITPSLTRAEIYETTARFLIPTSGEVNVRDFSDAMELCASSAFVSEDWVHKLFKQVSTTIQKQHNLKAMLKSLGPNGTLGREDLRTFLRQFQPNLCDSHINRVFGFLSASCPTGSGSITVHHLLDTVCRPTLGPVVGAEQSRLPLEDTSRLTVQLAQLCGGLEQAFDHLNPCLLYQEFCTSLQSLGFSSAFDFEKIFSVLDVHRSGRVSKSLFLSVSERFVRPETERSETEEHGSPAPVSSSSTRKPLEADRVADELADRLQYLRESFQARKNVGKNPTVSAAVHEELLHELQRGVNRLLVLESELQYRQRQEERDEIHMRRGLVDQLRDLETAHARLMAKLKVQAETISGLSSAQKTATSATSDAWEAGYSQGIAEYQSQVDELQKELDIAKLEKLRLQTQMLEREQKEQSSKVKLSTGDIQLSADDSSSTALVITDGDDREDARTRDDAEGVLREALSWFAHGRKIDALLSQVRGISIAGRFIVKEVATVEADAITLACADAFKKREVTLKTPIVDCVKTRANFLRECCVYTALSDVAEVQAVIHFPGLTAGLAYCVMELLHGRLLSQHLQKIRAGAEEPFPAHEAADICDAMLHGIEACHVRGVTHLDLKPSVIWEVAQPAGVVVKILDFGLARLSNLALLPPDARQFCRPAGHEDGVSPRLHFDDMPEASQPPATAGTDSWQRLAPFASLTGVGSPWYMSPARWCGLAQKLQQPSSAQPVLHLCRIYSGGNVWLERENGQDVVGVSKACAGSSAVQGARCAAQFPEGLYFEVQIRKLWPTAMTAPGTELGTGLAVGFTPIPPSGVPALAARAKDWPGWVVGYDGRFFKNGEQVVPTLDAPQFALLEFRRRREAKLAAAGTDDVDWPAGPLGWSFAELLRDDVLGVLATSQSLVIYVNGRVVSIIVADGIGDHGPLYPLIEICGVTRELAFFSKPSGPGGEEELDERFRTKDRQVTTIESLAPRSLSHFSDVYAAAVIAMQLFQSDVQPEAAPPLVQLLLATQMWLEDGRPAIADHNGMLVALSTWAVAVSEQTSISGRRLPAEIEEVIHRVFESSGAATNAASQMIRTAEEFRSALNERTACNHVSQEFLRSHVSQHVAPTSRKRVPTKGMQESGVDLSDEAEGMRWDLTPWTLSSSHIRRVLVVLQSPDSLHIRSVSIGRLEANVPDELQLRFAECFEGPTSSCREAREGSSSCHRALPRLLFREDPLPTDMCPVSMKQLLEANATGLLLRFVRHFDLQADLEETGDSDFSGPAAAKVIGTALRGNGALEVLNARNQHFGDTGVQHISKALTQGCRLCRLDLAQNRITPSGAQLLAQALMSSDCTVQHLELCGNEFGCTGTAYMADMLQGNATLIFLGLQRNAIGSSGAVSLGSALAKNYSLQELDLGRNCVGVSGSAALAAATRSNSSLQSLNLQDNQLEVMAGTKLAEELSAGLQRDLDGLLDAYLSKATMPRRSVKQRDGPAGSRLVTLNLRHNALGSLGGAAILAALQFTRTELSELNLAWNGLGMETAAALAGLLGNNSMCRLTKLDLRDNRGLGIGAELPKALGGLVSQMASASPDDEGSKTPRSAGRRSLKRDEPDRISEVQLSAQHLRSLNLANTGLDSEGALLLAPALASFSKLEELYLYNNIHLGCAPRTAEQTLASQDEWQDRSLKKKPPLVSASDGICHLTRCLPPCLLKLALGSCSLGAGLTADLLQVLTSHSTLQDLGLSDNDLGNDDAGGEGRLRGNICRFLQCSPCLVRLDLALNGLGDECALSIMSVMQEDKLVKVNFSANNLSQSFKMLLEGVSAVQVAAADVDAPLSKAGSSSHASPD
ncbi:NLRC3 [Symbiodinium microadriaticum]|nr:NLRC3 [Symbiodinium microadriaticum]